MTAVLVTSLWLLESHYVAEAGFKAALTGLLTLLAAGVASYAAASQVTGAFRLSDLKAAMRK
jgi:apolipoprotein N-acyltransferase